MSLELEQTNVPSQPMGDELMKVLIESVSGNGKAIRENTEAVRKLPDTTAILQELGKRITAQEKRHGELVESLGALKGGLGEVNGSLEKMMGKLSFPVDAFSRLRADLQRHVEFFEKPHRKEIHHTHLLSKPVLALIASVLIIGVLVVLLTQAWGRSDDHAENDLKWRFLHVSADTHNLDFLDGVNQRYKANPGQFKKDVNDEEDRQRQLFDQHQRATKAQDEIDKLEKKKR